jgi:hypothetical protein
MAAPGAGSEPVLPGDERLRRDMKWAKRIAKKLRTGRGLIIRSIEGERFHPSRSDDQTGGTDA